MSKTEGFSRRDFLKSSSVAVAWVACNSRWPDRARSSRRAPRSPSGIDPVVHLRRLQERLADVYPAGHSISLVTELTGRGSVTHRTLSLSDAGHLWTDIAPESALYVNRAPGGP